MESTKTSQFKDFASLIQGERYTVLFLNEMGLGANSVQFIHHEVHFRAYAQHTDALQLIMKPKRKREFRQMWFRGSKEFVVFKGWIDLDTDMFVAPSVEGPVTVCRSKYPSFDKRYLLDAIKRAKVAPLFQSEGISEVSHV